MIQYSYQLVGTLNLYNTKEDFVYPVFEKNGFYYAENSINNTIHSFSKINSTKLLKQIKKIDYNNTKLIGIKTIYNIGDQKPYAFQLDTNKIIICDIKTFIKFLKLYRTKEMELRAIINNFIAQNQHLTKEKVMQKNDNL